MATKAELEAELAELRKQLAEDEPDHGEEEQSDASESAVDLKGILQDHEFDPGDIEDLLAQLMEELNDLPKRKPLLTAGAAFALGFLLGRASK